MRVAFLTTHPIQYQTGWFRAMSEDPRLDLDILYCHNPTPQEQGSAGFGVPFTWDVPLFDGYRYRFLRNVSREPSTGTFFGLDTPELRRLIQNRRYDAVITNGWHYKSAWQAIVACWQAGIPILVRSDSHLCTARGRLKRTLKSLPYRSFISRLDGCLAVGQWSLNYFLHYGAQRSRIHIVPHVVSSAFESESSRLAARRREFREHWALGSADVVFLFAAKFTEEKRPLDFVRAVEFAARRNPRVAGLMVGDGPLRRTCEAVVCESGTPVRFTGFLNQSETVRAYMAADALVLPSHAETWGLVVNEAMTCGQPALVSDRVGCGPDLVQNGQTGFVFPFGDVEALSSLMLDLASCPGRLTSMGENARRKMLHYSIPAAVDAIVSALTLTVHSRQ
jgi:glycosyltransferase involved in cell wall biosynthesis